MSADSPVSCRAIFDAFSEDISMPFAIAINVEPVRFADSSDIPNCFIAVLANSSILYDILPNAVSTTFCTSSRSDAISTACLPKSNTFLTENAAAAAAAILPTCALTLLPMLFSSRKNPDWFIPKSRCIFPTLSLSAIIFAPFQIFCIKKAPTKK